MYQWTLQDSWLSILFSVILLIAVTGHLLYCGIIVLRTAARQTSYVLYTQAHYLWTYAPLFALYRTGRYYTHFILLAAGLLKAIFTAFAHANGEVQVIFILLIELAVLAMFIALRPHATRSGDALAIYLSTTRVICTGLLVAFVEQVGLSAIPRVIIGIVVAVLISAAVIVMFVNILINLWTPLTSSTEIPALEKGSPCRAETGRLARPTSEYMNPREPTVSYPDHSVQIRMEERNNTSEESRSTTLGSLLPRRCSVQPCLPSAPHTPSSNPPLSTLSSTGSPSRQAPHHLDMHVHDRQEASITEGSQSRS